MIDESDLLVEVRRVSGSVLAEDAHIDPAVRVTHVPTGLVAISESLDTQGANKAAAIEELERLLAARKRDADEPQTEHPGAPGATE